IGPEGGFTEEEIEQARKENIKLVYLGKRILRAETAALFLLSRIKQ
ncbi:MAG: RNA methyltransferase, partial [Mycoplasmataceae bacterium]|nr:RNA methyltransferase [Mycoplasmataceae bacterium]